MRVDNVDKSKKIGFIKFNSDSEMDLVAESMDRLIAKQQRLADKVGKKDREEIERLERFKKSKDVVVEIPRQNRIRMKAVTDRIKENIQKDNKGIRAGSGEIIDVEDTPMFKRASKVIVDSEAGSGLGEGTEVTHRNMHVLVNALNDHIWEMEKDGLYKKTRRNQQKYEKLQNLLLNAQEQKAQFDRPIRQKPRGFGRLRK
jgi:hypothetical protein